MMPELPNHSSYNRDKHQRVKPTVIQDPPIQSGATALGGSADLKQVASQDGVEKVFQALEQVTTTDIVEALKSTYPDIPNNQLSTVIDRIKQEAIARRKEAIISKFSL